mgnify:CR=1 FL=1
MRFLKTFIKTGDLKRLIPQSFFIYNKTLHHIMKCFLTFCGSYINLYTANINPDTLVYFLTSSVENFIPHPLQLKFSPTF